MPTYPAAVLAAAAILGLALPPAPVLARTIAMPLCNGGSVRIAPGDKRAPPDNNSGCHVACVMKRARENAERKASE